MSALLKTDMKFIKIGPDMFGELAALHAAYKAEIGEDAPTAEDIAALEAALNGGRIQFFGCVCGDELAACCSVCRVFSTYKYAEAGIFEDFYIAPQWRHKGIARKLVEFTYRESGVGSMTVGCADCDEAMYKALGFGIRLGNMLAYSEN